MLSGHNQCAEKRCEKVVLVFVCTVRFIEPDKTPDVDRLASKLGARTGSTLLTRSSKMPMNVRTLNLASSLSTFDNCKNAKKKSLSWDGKSHRWFVCVVLTS